MDDIKKLEQQMAVAAKQVRREMLLSNLWQRFVRWRREAKCRKGNHLYIKHVLIRTVDLYKHESDRIPMGMAEDYRCVCSTCGKIKVYREKAI